MEDDSYSALLEFDEKYWSLVESCYSVTQPCEKAGASTARPQGSCPHTAEQFLSKFDAMEKAFREEFISNSRRPAVSKDDSDSCRPAEVRASQPGVDSVRQLSNILSIYNELVALRQLSVALRRRCVFLENVQSLLQSQNSMLMDVVVGETARTRANERRRRGAVGAAPSPKTKRSLSEKHPTERTAEGPNGHPVLQYKGSGGLEGTDSQAAGKLQHRSMSADSIVDLDLNAESAASRRPSGVDGTEPADQQDRKRSGKLQEKWQQVKKVFAAKLDAGGGGTTAAGKPKTAPSDKLAKSESKKTTRSASATVGETVGKTAEPPQLQLLTVQQPSQQSRSASPRTPSTGDGADSSSCRQPSNTGSSSIGLDNTDRTLADVEDNWSGENVPRRKSVPNDRRQSLAVASAASVGRSSSFKMPKSTETLLTPGSAEGGGSKSLPTTPVELAEVRSTEQASPSTTGSSVTASSALRAKTTWTRVKDIVTTARRFSAEAPTAAASASGPGVEKVRSSSAERCKTVDDETDPWIEKRLRSKPGTTSDRGRSSASPPRTSERQQNRKRFSVSHATSTSVAGTTLSNSPLDLAGLLAAGVSEDFTKKMEEWESRKKKSISKAENVDTASHTKFTEEFIRKMEEWEQKKFAGDDSGLGGIQRSSVSTTAGRQLDRTVDDSMVQSTLSESFSRTVQDWERVQQSRGKSRSVSTATTTSASARKPSSTPPLDNRSKSCDREKSRQRAEKELIKLAKKEKKLEEEMRRLAAARTKLEAQLESSSASDRGGGSGSRGDSDLAVSADDERLLAALDLLENDDDETSISFSQRQPRGRSKSTRLRRQSCMAPSSTSTAFQRATSVGDPGRIKTNRKSVSAAGPPYDADGTMAECDSDSRQNQPGELSPTVEDASRSLRRQLEEKSDVISHLQTEIQQLVDRINSMETQHSAQLERYRKEMRLCSRCSQFERQSAAIMSSLEGLQQQLCAVLRDFDKHVSNSLDKQRDAKRSVEGEEDRNLLDEFSSGTQDSVLYTRTAVARLLINILRRHDITAQFSALKLCVAERNALIDTMQRHLLVQEVTNRLLLAELDRLDLDVQHLGELQSRRVIRRWKTYHGLDGRLAYGVLPTRRADRRQWACSNSRVILDAIHETLSQNVNVETPLVDSLLSSLQQTLRETVSTETQVEEERRLDVEVQTTLSVSPDSAATSQGGGAAVVGSSQWPPHQQHQQMLQLLLLQRQQQRPPANAPSSPRSPTASNALPGDAGGARKPRKGSAPEFATDFGRTLCVSAAANSAFRPVVTTRAGDWSPSRRAQHEPRLPYFEVRDVTGDAGKRFFRPIADGSSAVATSDGVPPTLTDDVFDDSKPLATADSAARVNHVSSAVGTSDANIAGTSRDVPADTVAKTAADRSPAAFNRTAEPPLPPAGGPTSRSYKTSSTQPRSPGTKLRRPYRSKTAELRLRQPPASVSTGSVSNSQAVERQVPQPSQDRKQTVDDEEEDALFDSEAGSVALSLSSVRSRAKSDSSVTHSLRSAASQKPPVGQVVAAGSSSSLLPVADRQQDHDERRCSDGWALDRGPPDGDRTAYDGARSLRTSPFRQSSSPLIVRKLKSAAELLRESNELHHRRRRSRPASSASSTRPPVTITGPQVSYSIIGTQVTAPSSTASDPSPSPSVQDAKPDPDPLTVTITSTQGTDSALQISETTTSSTADQKICVDSTVDCTPTENSSQPSSTVESETSEFHTETTIFAEPSCSATTPCAEAAHTDTTHEKPHSVTQTVEMARGSRYKFLDSNWFHVPKFFKTSK